MDFEQHKSAKDFSLVEMDMMCEELYGLRAEVEEIEKTVSEKNKRVEELKAKILGVLEETGRDRYSTSKGLISIREIETVKVENKDELIKFLAEKDSINLLSMNHQTLQAWYKSQKEAAEDKLNFSLPGIGEPKVFKTITMRKG